MVGPAEAAQRSAQIRTAQRLRRHSSVLALHVAGFAATEIAKRLGLSHRTICRDLRDSLDNRNKVDDILRDDAIDMDDIHIRLSDMFDADIADILDDHGDVRPVAEWPLIWRQGLAGEVKVEDVSQRSHDGETRDKSGGWDSAGKKITIKRESILRIMELAGRLKGVDAYVQQQGAQNVEVHLHAEVGERLRGALRREQALIDVVPESVALEGPDVSE